MTTPSTYCTNCKVSFVGRVERCPHCLRKSSLLRKERSAGSPSVDHGLSPARIKVIKYFALAAFGCGLLATLISWILSARDRAQAVDQTHVEGFQRLVARAARELEQAVAGTALLGLGLVAALILWVWVRRASSPATHASAWRQIGPWVVLGCSALGAAVSFAF